MSDLRLIGRTEDGTELELKDHNGASYTLRVSDHLRALVNQSVNTGATRLVSVGSPAQAGTQITVKEIQNRLRNGESIESLERTTGWSAEKIEKFAGPIMQERAYIIEVALKAVLGREKYAPTLAVATEAQLAPRGVDLEKVEWNTWRNDDGSWNLILIYPTKDGGTASANWSFDLQSRVLSALDDGARWISGEEKVVRPETPTHGIISPSTPAPRLVAVREEVEVETIRITTTPDTLFTPDLAPVVDTEIPADAKRDGVTKRLKIPSWDDIMFGGRSDKNNSEHQESE